MKAAKTKVAGEAFLIKRNAKQEIVGDYVVAPGHSILCAAGNKKAGMPILPKHLGDEMFEKAIKAKAIINAPVKEK